MDDNGLRTARSEISETVGGQTINIDVIYLLKGPNLLAFGDSTLDVAAASVDSLKTQAATSLERMP